MSESVSGDDDPYIIILGSESASGSDSDSNCFEAEPTGTGTGRSSEPVTGNIETDMINLMIKKNLGIISTPDLLTLFQAEADAKRASINLNATYVDPVEQAWNEEQQERRNELERQRQAARQAVIDRALKAQRDRQAASRRKNNRPPSMTPRSYPISSLSSSSTVSPEDVRVGKDLVALVRAGSASEVELFLCSHIGNLSAGVFKQRDVCLHLTPLELAIVYENVEKVRLLLNAGAPVDVDHLYRAQKRIISMPRPKAVAIIDMLEDALGFHKQKHVSHSDSDSDVGAEYFAYGNKDDNWP